MNRQKGQSAVELALILPLFFAMCFGMIYGAIMFLDYLQFNNAARDVAREIAMTDSDNRARLKAEFENLTSEHINQLTNLYTAKPSVNINTDANNVTVEVDLILNEDSLPKILSWINFPPKTLKAVRIVMPLEKINLTMRSNDEITFIT